MHGNDNVNAKKNSPSGDGGRQYNMHFGANSVLFDLAEQLRTRMTAAEEVLWKLIKINDWHLKFTRQHPLSLYLADFYCHQVKLVIELDGGYHENKEVKIYDEKREDDLKEFGITVLRFKNEEVLYKTEDVLNTIASTISMLQQTLVSTEKKKLFVIKIGGNIIDDEKKLQDFLTDLSKINLAKNAGAQNNSPLGDGGRCILIHGGGKIATKIGDQLGIESKYINGRRITDEATIDVVTMVYGGLVNKQVVAKLQSLNCNAIGLTGADANIIPAVKRPVKDIDYGFAGDVLPDDINAGLLDILLQQNITPVIAPLTHDGKGQILNTNADTIASSLAVALSALYDVRLIYCFEKKGILENIEDENSVINLITKEKYQQLLADKKLFDGILPKIDNAFAAIENGVKEVLIGDAKDLLQNLTEHTAGTLIQ